MCVVSIIDVVDEELPLVQIEERFGLGALAAIILNFNVDDINEHDEMVNALFGIGSLMLQKSWIWT